MVRVHGVGRLWCREWCLRLGLGFEIAGLVLKLRNVEGVNCRSWGG